MMAPDHVTENDNSENEDIVPQLAKVIVVDPEQSNKEVSYIQLLKRLNSRKRPRSTFRELELNFVFIAKTELPGIEKQIPKNWKECTRWSVQPLDFFYRNL